MSRLTVRLGIVGVVLAMAVGVMPTMASASQSAPLGIPGLLINPLPAKPKMGGTMTVLLGAGLEGSWTNLGVLGNPMVFNGGFYDAVYGTLFGQLNDGKIIPQLATSGKYSNGGRTFTITLRQGVTFSDGTPFNAQAVLYNWQNNLAPGSQCPCTDDFPVASMTAPDPYTVVMNLKYADGALRDAFPNSSMNWIESPAHWQSLNKTERSADLFPVGAGPFKITADVPNVTVTMVKNPNYWDKPYPYLNKVIFKTIGNDSSALAAVQSGEAQVYGGYGEYQNLRSIVHSVDVYGGTNGTSTDTLAFNLKSTPFNNLVAREAIAYATQPEPINRALFANTATVTQTPTGPGSPFYFPTVPGYRGYNLKKAKALVKQLGGLTVSILSQNDLQTQQVDEALQSEWAKAGIHTTIEAKDMGTYIQNVLANKWQIEVSNAGSFDPAVGFGLAFDFGSKGILSGVRDPNFDAMLQAASEPLDQKARHADYARIFKYMSDKQYYVGLWVGSLFTLTAKNVTFSTKYLGLFAPPLQAYYETLAYTNSKTS
ncbi:MAG: ABC transporter substrate-binding protein [Acidimicrobiales bacterium]